MRRTRWVVAAGMAVATIPTSSEAQQSRITSSNTIGWFTTSAGIKLTEKWGAHLEYQFRRDDLILDWQQSLARVGASFQVHPRLLLRVGYAWVETFPYGDAPINAFGRTFTEHRAFQMAQLAHKEDVFDITQRLMLEQRFIGQFDSAAAPSEARYPVSNRLRYMLRLQLPLSGRSDATNRAPYVAAYDEILIGFGENVGQNVFDQNRAALLLGCAFTSLFRAEAGYLNQTLQLGREIEGRSVWQYNHGLIVNTQFTFDLSRRVDQLAQ